MLKIIACAFLACMAADAFAQTVYSYEYDALGRLTKATPGSGAPTRYVLDPAGNRVTVTNLTNSAPVAVDDYLYYTTYSTTGGNLNSDLHVLDNDTDIDLPGDTQTVTVVTGSVYATVKSGGSDVHFSGPPGFYTLSYTMKDSHNVTSSATIYLDIFYCENAAEC